MQCQAKSLATHCVNIISAFPLSAMVVGLALNNHRLLFPEQLGCFLDDRVGGFLLNLVVSIIERPSVTKPHDVQLIISSLSLSYHCEECEGRAALYFTCSP